MRCSDSPMVRASLVCRSMQKAQPLICEARILTSSRSLLSRPVAARYLSNPSIASYAPGEASFSTIRCRIASPFNSDDVLQPPGLYGERLRLPHLGRFFLICDTSGKTMRRQLKAMVSPVGLAPTTKTPRPQGYGHSFRPHTSRVLSPSACGDIDIAGGREIY